MGVLPLQSTAAPVTAVAVPAVIIAVEGSVQVLSKGTTNWVPAKAGQPLKVGDQLRTGARSRATVRLSNLSVLRVGELMEYAIQPARTADGKPVLDLKRGSAYFFSRDKPHEMQFRTPIATGAIRGTEFNITVGEDGRTTVTLMDGEVELANEQGSLALGNGEEGVVETGRPPYKTAVLNAVNVIQWSLYYPGVLDPQELGLSEAEQQTLAESLAAYRSGDLVAALNKYPQGHAPASAADHIYLGGLLLSVGLVEQSEAQLQAAGGATDTVLRLADALRQVVAAVKFQSWEARRAPELASEWVAESYDRQAHGALHEALASARKAVEKTPEFGFGRARVAELEFGFGHTAAALKALNQSLAAAPRNAQAVALKGFLLSAENRIGEAAACFDEAIALDGALGNAWLGRGLCRIRRGQGEAGREDLQTAAALEPNRALLRSYLSKAFSHAGDAERAAKELALAEKLDPNDPTAWLYSALLNRRDNQVNDAVRDLEKSQGLNENRRLYRSRLLLDQDQAVRSANLAAIYQDAGMTEVSAREAGRAVQSDYGNYSAHLFLANSFDALRDPKQVNLRYETAWLNEYLLANLLAPVGAGALSPQISQQEYSRFFERDGLGVASSTDYFSNGDWAQGGSQFGRFGNSSYALDANYRHENGQRPNNDLDQVTLSLQFKQQITPQDSIYLQTIYYNAESGDLAQYYNQADANPDLRLKERQEPLLLAGYHHEWAPGSHTLFLGGWLNDTFEVSDPTQQVVLGTTNAAGFLPLRPINAKLNYESELEIYTAELQQLWKIGRHGLICGIRYQTGEYDTRSRQTDPSAGGFFFPGGVLSDQDIETDFERVSLYGYHNWQILDPLLVTIGVSYDHLRFPDNFRSPPLNGKEDTQDKVSPKAGVIWTPTDRSTVRGSYTRSLGGVSFDQSFRLEPSQIAGFSQSYRSILPESVSGAISAPEFECAGLGVDYRFPSDTYVGIEAQILNSEADRTAGSFALNFAGPSATAFGLHEHLDYTERVLAVNVNQLLGREWAFGARYRLSNAELDDHVEQISGSENETEATLHQLNLFVLYNHRCGFFARTDGLWNSQNNTGYGGAMPGDDFWQFNAVVGYRFLRRHAELAAGMLNITDQDYQLNPLTYYAELPRERTFTLSLRFNF